MRVPHLTRAGPLAVAVALALCTRAARAHEAYEITAEGRLLDAALDLEITMAGETAAKVCGATPVEVCARGLFAISDGGQPLAPRTARAARTVEGDVQMAVIYPRPERGPLVLDAVLLRRLPDPSYGVVLTVVGDRRFLGQRLLRADDPRMEIPIARARSAVPWHWIVPVAAIVLVLAWRGRRFYCTTTMQAPP